MEKKKMTQRREPRAEPKAMENIRKTLDFPESWTGF